MINKKYFFFDIDGTLTTGKSFLGGIPQSAIDAIAKLKEQGHVVCIATGRPYATAKLFAKDAGIEHIVCNGGYTCFVHGKFIRNKGMDLKDCHKVMQECFDKNIPLVVSTSDDFKFYAPDDSFLKAIEGDEFNAELEVVPQLNYFELPDIFRMLIAMDRGIEETLHCFDTLVPSRYHDRYVIVEPDDKYDGVLHMVNALQGDEADIVVFGDGRNDITMFQHAPMSIAMGNGVDELKAMATYVTKRSDEDGLAYALQHFGWI